MFFLTRTLGGRRAPLLYPTLFHKILAFSLPLVLTNLLQILYNMADMIVVGRFSAVEGAVGAIGSTTSLINLINNFIFGIGAGATVLVAQAFGAHDRRAASRGVHTSLIMGVALGLFSLCVGQALCRTVLVAMNTAPEYLDMAVTYCRICFAGLPFVAVLNVALGILRAQGDTTRPLIILSAAGLLNVILNIVFVAGCGMDVDGVALATLIANIASAVAAMTFLHRDRGICGFRWRRLRLHTETAKRVLTIGVPSGLQGMLFSASNLVVQSAINLFGPATITAAAIATSLESFGYTAGNSVANAALTFTGQNIGAKNYRRILPVLYNSFAASILLSGIVALIIYLLQQPLAGLYMHEDAANRQDIFEALRIATTCRVLFIPICGLMECGAFSLRSMGHSTLSMVNSLLGAGGLRILWVLTLFAAFPNRWVLFINYPITWAVTAVVQYLCVRTACRRLIAQQEEETVTV